MSDFVKFLAKYADEALSIGDALATVVSGIALHPNDAASVHAVIDKLKVASAAILEGLGDVDKDASPKITIQKKDIEAAVAAKLPALVPSTKEVETMIAAAVNAALDARTKPDA